MESVCPKRNMEIIELKIMNIFQKTLEKTKDFPTSMIRGEFLYLVSEHITDYSLIEAKIVEIGACHGGLTLKLATIVKDHNLSPAIIVDIWDHNDNQAKLEGRNEESYKNFLNIMNRSNLIDYIKIIKKDSYIAGKENQEKISFIVIDGNHNYENVKKDLSVWLPHVIKNGLILIDDLGPWGTNGGPQQAIHEYMKEHPGKYKIKFAQHTIGLIEKIK